jgi:ADP-ribosyl-[dinitrogen reductase] hydrolase
MPGWVGVEPAVTRLAHGDYLSKSRDSIRGTGYCIESLEAALWCFHTTSSYEEAVLTAANLGDDADTTAAIVGQIAGAHYGAAAIPTPWLDRLHLGTDIASLADKLWQRQTSR